MQYNLFDIEQTIARNKVSIEDLFDAYFLCRSNKRYTANALRFEVDYESQLISLWKDINSGSYHPGRSICFILNKPVTREIFAADFRDRIVHHLVIRKLNPLFEKAFIHDSYACREGKGTHFGIKRLDHFIRSCSRNYTRDCHVLKLDIQGFFMFINRKTLFDRLHRFILEKYKGQDRYLIIDLCRKIIFNDPAQNCTIKGSRMDWKALPKNKSLFHSPPDCGLPIGNLTSQVFANFYMNSFDHYIKHDLGIRHYGRYVDDFVLVHQDPEFLKSLIPKLKGYLQTQLGLTLHPRKIYMQHYTKGVQFLGTFIKPHRAYIARRTKGNFFQAIQKQNALVKERKPTREEQSGFLSSMNSYLGIMKHYNTYTFRKRMLYKYLSGWWWNYMYLGGGISKFTRKIEYGYSKGNITNCRILKLGLS